MKKLLLSTLVLCMAFFASCSKDSDSASNSGGGSTLKRLHESYQDETYYRMEWNEETQVWDTTYHYIGEPFLTSTWNWNGNNLTSISGGDWLAVNFYYNDANLVTKIVSRTTDGHQESDTTYFYYNSNNQINKIDRYRWNEDISAYEFSQWEVSYSGDKPTRISCLHLDGTEMRPYSTLTWTGDNVTKRQVFYDENSMMSEKIYTYDNHISPQYGFNCMTAYSLIFGSYMPFEGIHNTIVPTGFCSKGNELTREDGEYTYTYRYTYDGDYPIARSSEDIKVWSGVIVKHYYPNSLQYVYLN